MIAVKVLIIVIVCTFIGAVLIGAFFLIAIVLSRHEDEADYLDCFLDRCTLTEEDKVRALRDLEKLKYKIAPARYSELEDRIQKLWKIA